MRIRKNAKLSSLLRSPPEAPLSSHVCQLNQSPWDVLPFSFPDALPPSSSSSLLAFQLDGGEDNFTTNGSSFGNSIGAVESSVASMMAVDAEEKTVIVNKREGRAYNRMNIEDGMNINSYEAKSGGDFDGDFSFKACCNKTDGKRWQCKNEAVDGHYLCKHHLSQLKSYATTAADDDDDHDDDENAAANAHDPASRKLEKSSAFTGRRGGRPRGAKKSSTSSAAANSNQFYYYSGFGPSWGKRRSGRAGDQPGRPERRAGQPTQPRIGGEGIDYVDYDVDEEEEEEEEDDDDDGDSGKKRMRKPVKARSLKSLM